MSDFTTAFNATLFQKEGFPGFNRDNNGADVCGGVNRASWPGWAGWAQVDAAKAKVEPGAHFSYSSASIQAVNALLKKSPDLLSMLDDFYRRNFWMPSYNDITSQAVANWIFDHGVNMGLDEAVKLLQRAAGVTDDGKFGSRTLAAINAADPSALVKLARQHAVEFYEALHAKDPIKYPASMASRA